MMVDLCRHRDEGYVALRDIAERQGISKKYLEQIVPLLNNAGMLQTGRGYQGGYRLLKEPSEYTVADILRTAEGSLAPVSCLEVSPVQCEHYNECATVGVWEGLYKVIDEYLSGITLADLAEEKPNEKN